MSSSPVSLKTCRVGQRCTLNLSRAGTSSRWLGGIVTETTVHCYTACRNPLPAEPGTCCPVCPECSNEDSKEGDVELALPQTDPCVTCSCMGNSSTCMKKACPVLPCPPSKHIYKRGMCCPECAAAYSSSQKPSREVGGRETDGRPDLPFRCHRPRMGMEFFTNTELADMHLIFGLEEGHAQAAERLYREKYPLKDASEHRMLANLHHNLCVFESLRGSRHSEDGPRVTRTPNMVLGFPFVRYPTHFVPCMEQNVGYYQGRSYRRISRINDTEPQHV
ncbi:BMP-binding endothelial regulator protein [Trichonephila clavipes]|nr:BMP-binding endothelial regulator protein [Trichonephila clavipes]